MGHPIGGASALGVPTRSRAPVPTSTGAQYLHVHAFHSQRNALIRCHVCLASSNALHPLVHAYITFDLHER